MLATHYCAQLQKNVRNKQTQLIDLIKIEKHKPSPNQHKLNNAHQQLQDVDNYKITGSIICSKEKLVLDQEKQKQKSKTIKQLQKEITNNETKPITVDDEILTYCKTFFSNLYTNAKNKHTDPGRIINTNSI